tara:strand:+ start:34 stop:288 length:255 start_codon:yes stop_codon:yes gene_type:complete
MKVEIFSVADKAPVPGVVVWQVTVEDGEITDMELNKCFTVQPPDDPEEQRLLDMDMEGMPYHPTLEWERGGTMLLADLWMERRV